jgi:tryptophan-rich sensory protein
MAIFESLINVLVFWVVSLLFLDKYLHGKPSRFMIDMTLPKWYHEYKCYVKGAPPGWVFGLFWTVIYVLLVVSVYFFYKSAFIDLGPGVKIDVYTLFLFFNVICNNMWYGVFFDMARPDIAAFMIIGCISTGVGILAILGIENKWLEFGLFIPYVVWLTYALFLNIYWWVIFSRYNIYEKYSYNYISNEKKNHRRNHREN